MDKQQILKTVVQIIRSRGFYVSTDKEVGSTEIRLDLGLDSIDEIELVSEIEKYFVLNLSYEVFERLKTLDDYTNVIQEYMPRSYRIAI